MKAKKESSKDSYKHVALPTNNNLTSKLYKQKPEIELIFLKTDKQLVDGGKLDSSIDYLVARDRELFP